MRLVTKKIEKIISKYPLYSQESNGEDAEIICKFFFGSFTWYVLEGQKIDGDFQFFGLVDVNGEREYGYFTLSELQSIKYMGHPCVERDLYFDMCKVKDIEKI